MDPHLGNFSNTSLKPPLFTMIGHPGEGHAPPRRTVADILHSVLADAAYEDIVGTLKGRYGDHQLTATYWAVAVETRCTTIIKKDCFQLPRIDVTLDTLAVASGFRP
jgi:hypothetical protein